MIIGPHYAGVITPYPMQLILPNRFRNGRFRVQVMREGRPFFDSGFNKQVMTNSFFETYLGGTQSRSQLLQYAAVGTGTAAASESDTTITQVGPRAAAQAVESSASVAGNVITQRVQYRWAQGAITVPVTEAALFAAASGGSTMVRQRLKDSGGTDTSVPLTAMDALYLTWEVDSTVNLSDVDTVVTYGGVDYNVKLRPSAWTGDATTVPTSSNSPFAAFSASNNPASLFGFQVAQAGGPGAALGAVTGVPSGGAGFHGSSNSAVGSYVALSRQRTISHTWESGNAVNALGGIRVVRVYTPTSGAGYQMRFGKVSDDSPLPKDETMRFRLDLVLSYDT